MEILYFVVYFHKKKNENTNKLFLVHKHDFVFKNIR